MLPPSVHYCTIYHDGGAKHCLGGVYHYPRQWTSDWQHYGIRRMGLSSCSLSPRKLTTGSIALSQPLKSVWIAVLGQ